MANLIVSQTNIESALVATRQRFVVLTPQVDGLEAELAHRIWLLASTQGHAVLYLGLVEDVRNEPLWRRRMATLAALTRDRQTRVETALSFEGDWLSAVQSIWRPTDVIICPAELSHSVGSALDQTLMSALRAPVHRLSYLDKPVRVPHRLTQTLRRRVLRFLPFLIVAACFILQVQIATWPHHWAYYALMFGSVLLEAVLIGLSVRTRDQAN